MCTIFKHDNHFQQCNDLIKSLYQKKEHADVTLVSDDNHQFEAHAFLLGNSSTVFKSILEKNYSQKTHVYLRGIHRKELQSILQLIYLGEAVVEEETIEEFLKVTKEFGLQNFGEQLEIDIFNFNEVNDLNDRNVNEETVLKSINNKNTNVDRFAKEPAVQNFGEQYEIGNEIAAEELETIINFGVHFDTKEYKEEKDDRHFETKEFAGAYNNINLNNPNELSCQQCEYKTVYSMNLRRHIQAKHTNFKIPCSACSYSATTKANLKEHMQAKHLNVHYDCPFCEHQATKPFNLKYHIQSKHKSKLECGIGECYYRTQSMRRLTTHQKEHHGKIDESKIQFAL